MTNPLNRLTRALVLAVAVSIALVGWLEAVELPATTQDQITWFDAQTHSSFMTVNVMPPSPTFWHVRTWDGSEWDMKVFTAVTSDITDGSVTITNDTGTHTHAYVGFDTVLGDRFALQVTLTAGQQVVFSPTDGSDRSILTALPAGDSIKTLTVVRDGAQWEMLLDGDPVAVTNSGVEDTEQVRFGISLLAGQSTTVHDFRITLP